MAYEQYCVVMSWLHCSFAFALLCSVVMHLRVEGPPLVTQYLAHHTSPQPRLTLITNHSKQYYISIGLFGKYSWGALEKEERKCSLKWCGIAKVDTFRSQGKDTIWWEGLTEVGMKGDIGCTNSSDDMPRSFTSARRKDGQTTCLCSGDLRWTVTAA